MIWPTWCGWVACRKLLTLVFYGLSLLARLPATTARTRTPSTRQRAGGNAEIVASIHAAVPEGMDLQDIENATSERGTPLDNEQVRSAVTYLAATWRRRMAAH